MRVNNEREREREREHVTINNYFIVLARQIGIHNYRSNISKLTLHLKENQFSKTKSGFFINVNLGIPNLSQNLVSLQTLS